MTTFNPDEQPYCAVCGARDSADHQCDPHDVLMLSRHKLGYSLHVFEQVFGDPDRRHDAERNGDVPTRIERLMQE